MLGPRLLVVDDSPTVLQVIEATLAEAAFETTFAVDAGDALAKARATLPSAILLASSAKGPTKDDMSPALRFCELLASDGKLRAIPVVLMTGRTESADARFSRLTNIADHIRKPFAPDALIAVVQHVLGTRGNRGASVPLPPSVVPAASEGATPEAADGAATAPAPVAPSTTVTASTPSTALHTLRRLLAERLERHRQDSGGWNLSDLMEGAFDDVKLEALLTQAGYFQANIGPAGSALSGDMAAISMGEVLALLGEQRHTGCLRAHAGSAFVEVSFRQGLVDFASASGVADGFLLGRFAAEIGALGEALDRVLTERATQTSPPLLGEDLVERALMTKAQLQRALERQTSELVFELLRWTTGNFYFRRTDDLPETARRAALGMRVEGLLLEGFRQVEEWRVIERAIVSFDEVFVRNDAQVEQLRPGTLARDEIHVLDLVNGRHSVRDIVRASRLGSFDVGKILYRLRRSHLIRDRTPPVVAR